MLRFLAQCAFFCAMSILAGEIFFRLVIPACDPPMQVQEPAFAIMHGDTSGERDGLFTFGRLAVGRCRWHLNNAGNNWLSDYEPLHPGRKPVIAIIGDSFVQGFFIREGADFPAVLETLLDRRADVYTFAEAGATLADGMVLARFAASRYAPDAYVFLVNLEEPARSLYNCYEDSRFMQLFYKDGQFTEIERGSGYHTNRWRRWLRHSAIARYVTFNADVGLFAGARTTPAIPKPAVADTVLLRKAMTYVVGKLRADLPGRQIVFMVHETPDRKSPPVLHYLQAACDANGAYLFDLNPCFARADSTDSRPTHYSFNEHWNAYGHRLCATALAGFLERENILRKVEEAKGRANSLVANKAVP